MGSSREAILLETTPKVSWQGTVIGAQPRIRLLRSFDQRNHTYLGYSLHLSGTVGNCGGEFTVGIGKAAQAKHEFRAGDVVSGASLPVADSRKEVVEFYKTSRLKLISRGSSRSGSSGATIRRCVNSIGGEYPSGLIKPRAERPATEGVHTA